MKSLQIGLFWSLCFLSSYAQESYLLVSSGGGIAGTATVYKIDKSGMVKKGQGLGEIEYTEEGKLKKCATKRYFKRAKAVLKSSPDFIHPGNMYSSLALYEEGKESRITWGHAEFPAPEEAKKLYSKINTAVSGLKFSSGLNKN
jgi:hypothetical protein